MNEIKMPVRITKSDVEKYKREILEQSVLVSAKDAGHILARKDRTVSQLVHDGELRGFGKKGSKGLRVLASELRDYVRSIEIDRDAWNE